VSPLATGLAALGALVLFGLGVARPTRTIIPLYAALVPMGGVFELPAPLPSPFNTLSSLVGAMAILATIVHIVLYGRTRIPTLPVAVWLVFLAWCTVSAFWALRPRAALEEVFVAVPLVMLLVAVGMLRTNEEDVRSIQLAVVVGGASVGAYAVLLLMIGSALPIHGTAQRFSIATDPSQTNPNQVAAMLLLPLLLALDMAMWGRGPGGQPRTWRYVGGACSLLITVALILTGSRGGVIAAGTGFLLILIFAWRWHPEVRRAVMGVVVGTVMTIAVVGSSYFAAAKLSSEGSWVDRSSAPLQRLIRFEEGSSGRTEIWATGVLACRSFCGWGVGLGNFPVVFTDLFATSGVGRNVGLDRPGHALYLELAVEIGLVGLTLLGLALAAEWIAVRRTGRIAPALAASLVALLVVDAFESFIWFKYFWLLFMVVRVAEGAMATDRAARRPWLLGIADDLSRPSSVRHHAQLV
jgi:O-antigen ligase